MKYAILLLACLGLLTSTNAPAAAHDIAIPLQDGKLELASLTQAIPGEIHLPESLCEATEINLNGWKGSLFVASLNAACGEGCHVAVESDQLLIHIDPKNLPRNVDLAKSAVRTFVATDYPEATAEQSKQYGLFLPTHLDPAQPLLVLVHGLDTGIGMLQPMGQALVEHGYQVAYFGYPSDQAIDSDVNLLTQKLIQLRREYPTLRVDLIGHSMGGLVARGYVEGDCYQGNVDHLFLVGTPNQGAKIARFHLFLKAQEHLQQWQMNPHWRWTWMITDGLGEGARDLMPRSSFLKRLNSRPRSPGVAYTIVAGSHSTVATAESKLMAAVSHIGGDRARQTWGVGTAENVLAHEAARLAQRTGSGDGAVSLASAKLAGVNDLVVLPADHCGLFIGNANKPPAALPVILERLSKNQN